jgi:hypothetical protein
LHHGLSQAAVGRVSQPSKFDLFGTFCETLAGGWMRLSKMETNEPALALGISFSHSLSIHCLKRLGTVACAKLAPEERRSG